MTRTLFSSAIADTTGMVAFSDDAIVTAMMQFEVALATAQAECGMIPTDAAQAITHAARSFAPDIETLATQATQSASIAIPFVNALQQHVANENTTAACFLHFGATSQDLVDTALALCTQRAVQIMDDRLRQSAVSIRRIILAYAATPMLARTLQQPAGVTTVGYTALQWLEAIGRARDRIRDIGSLALCVSLGGPTGQLSTFGADGEALRIALARQLGLACPRFMWHTYRDDWMTLAAAVATMTGTLHKIAKDIAYGMQAEVNEFSERRSPGSGGSSALPHKRNPVRALRVIANATPVPGFLGNLLSCMPQEHQRALGLWQSETAQWPQLIVAAVDTTVAFAELIDALDVNPAGARHNIDQHRGVVLSERLSDCWSPLIGKSAAMKLVASLCDQVRHSDRQLLDIALEARQHEVALQAVSADQLRNALDIEHIVQTLSTVARSGLK